MGMRTLPGAVGVPTDVTAAAPVVVPGAAILDDPITARVLYQAWSGDAAVVVPSPPGAGKTRLVVLLAVSLAERAGLRVAVAAQTREQAAEIARRMDGHTSRAGLMWPSKHPRPNVGARVVVHKGGSAAWPSDGGAILVAHDEEVALLRPVPAGVRCDDRGRGVAGHLRRRGGVGGTGRADRLRR